jgi:hypothetical protein
MEPIVHDEELEGIPSCVRAFIPIGVVNFAAELADNALHHPVGWKHPGMALKSEVEGEKSFQAVHLSPEATVEESLALLSPAPQGSAFLIAGAGMHNGTHQLREERHPSIRPLVLIQEIPQPGLLGMAEAQLDGTGGEDLLGSSQKPWISIENESFEGVGDLISQLHKDPSPIVGVFDRSEQGCGNILGGDIRRKKESMVFPFDGNGLAISKQPPSPLGMEFVSDFDERFAVGSQSVDPSKSRMRIDSQRPAHRSIGGLLVEIQVCGQELLLARKFEVFGELPSTSETLEPLNSSPGVPYLPRIAPCFFDPIPSAPRASCFFRP